MKHPKAPPKPPATKKSATFDGYLANLIPEQRSALEKLRRDIHAAAPSAEEYISYGLPAFRLDGKFLLAIGATAKHCSFHIGATLQRHSGKLRAYTTSKGTIRFPANQPLPTSLVRTLVRARLAEAKYNTV